jgi:hypothetical protein
MPITIERVKWFTRKQKMLGLGFMGLGILLLGIFIRNHARRGRDQLA